MPGRLSALATRYAGRPVLMLPRSALEIAEQLHGLDAHVFDRPNRLQALFRGLRGAQARAPIVAMDDEDSPPPVPFHERAAYTPLYIGDADDIGYCWALKDGVALLQVNTPFLDEGEVFCGTVYHGYDTLLAGLRDAAADDRVKALFVRMSSPGGPVSGRLSALSAWMRANRGAAGGKPIHVYADMACSAAYWASAPADKIWAPKEGLVASIGCVLVHYDYSAAAEKMGVAITPVQFGAKKTDGAWWEALSPTAKADLQAEIDQCGRNFVADVVLSRPKLTSEALLATEAGVFLAQHDDSERSGADLGFVDEISGEEDAFAALAAQVSAPQATGTPQPARTGGPAAQKPTQPDKEAPMALDPKTQAAREAALTAAKANAAKAQADLEAAEAAMKDDGDAEDAEDAADGGSDEAAEGEADGEDQEGKNKPSTEAAAIAASDEAKAHPALALAAVSSGQTLAQFKASVAAAGKPKGPGALAAAMAGQKRLGPDMAQAGAKKARSAAEIFAANQAKGREIYGATRR